MTTIPITAEDPRTVYAGRRAERQQTADLLDRQLDRLGLARLAVFGAGLVTAWLAFGAAWISPGWLAVPAVAFVGLLFRCDRVSRRLARAVRAVRFYARGLERLDDRWMGHGQDGKRYLDEHHLYALDLDIFGTGSLYERLCTARTRPGEDTLAGWLLAPATPDEVRARQAAVGELRPRLDLRETLALLGAELPPVDFAALAAWGSAPPLLHSRRLRLLTTTLAVLNLSTFAAGGLLGVGWTPFFLAALAAGGVAGWLRDRVRRVLAPVESMGRDLALLSGLLARLEREPFATPRLREIQTALQVAGMPPSRQIAELVGLVDWLNARRNQLFVPLALLLLWQTQMALALEAWRVRSGPRIGRWLAAIGVFEALSALAAYAYENPDDRFPEVTTGPACFDAQELGHPLLPRNRGVRNDLSLAEPVRLLLVSGSNMSGKSTLLRAVGVNVVLALAGAPVRAQRLRLTPLELGATLRIQDSLLEGRSRFFAEVTRIRQILDRSRSPVPVLFLLDELFHGTNSHDRGVGAEALLRQLHGAGAIGLVTTHDLALTQITDRLGSAARNVHFADQFRDGTMCFDYRLRPGVVPHSNALALMRAVGLEV